MRWKRALAIVLRQMYLLRASPARVVPLFAWVGIDIVLWGFITKYLNTIVTRGFSFVPTILGAVLLWDFMVRVMQGITTAFFEDVWTRNFLNVFATPLSITEYISGLVLSSVITSSIGLIIMLLLSTGVFGLSFFAYGIVMGAFLLVLFLFGIALGIFAAAVVLRLGPAAEWFIWPIPALLSPFAGVFYPLSTLPAWMRGIAISLPASHVFEGMRAVVASGAASSAELLRGLGLALLYIALAMWFFVKIYSIAVRDGLIARYSAESVT